MFNYISKIDNHPLQDDLMNRVTDLDSGICTNIDPFEYDIEKAL